MTFIYPTSQKNQTPQQSLLPPVRAKPTPFGTSRCFKCQGFGHIGTDSTNQRVIILAKWEVVKEEDNKEEGEAYFEENLEEN